MATPEGSDRLDHGTLDDLAQLDPYPDLKGTKTLPKQISAGRQSNCLSTDGFSDSSSSSNDPELQSFDRFASFGLDPTAALPPRLASRLLTVRRHQCLGKSHHTRTHSHPEAPRARHLESTRPYTEKIAAVRQRAAAERSRATSRLLEREARCAAAQAAREQRLRAISTAAAAEVRRAKAVAKEARQRASEAAAAGRASADEKLERAARRRAELRRNDRKVPANEMRAARTIQRVWRRRRIAEAIGNWKQIGMTKESVSAKPFAGVTGKMGADAITAVQKLSAVCGKKLSDADARTLLCAFLLVGHTREVLSFWGPREEALVESAKSVVDNLDSLPNADTTRFVEAAADFVLKFGRWKEQDKAVMAAGIVAAFVEMDVIVHIVEGQAAAEFRPAIDANKALLLSNLGKLVGKQRAREMMLAGIRESRRLLRRRPRGSTLPTSEPIPSVRTVGANPNSPPPRLVVVPVPTRLPVRAIPSNRVLVHELAINPAFQLTPFDTTETNKDVAKTVADAIANPDQRTQWVHMIAEVLKSKMSSLLESSPRMAAQVEKMLSPESIEEALNDNFDPSTFFIGISRLCAAMCAPARDEDIASLINFMESTASDEDKLARLLGAMDVLALDNANFYVARAGPIVRQHGRSYEMREFTTIAANTGLPRLHRLWAGAKSSANDMPENQSTMAVYSRLMTAIIGGTRQLEHEEIPETLDLDFERLSDIRLDVTRIITAAALLIHAKNILRRSGRDRWPIITERLMTVLEGAAEVSEMNELVRQVVGAFALPMPEASHGRLTEAVRRVIAGVPLLRPLAEAPADNLDPLLRLLRTRLQTLLVRNTPTLNPSRAAAVPARLATGVVSRSPQQDESDMAVVAAAAAASMPDLGSHIHALVKKVDNVVRVDSWHWEWYERLNR